jgi:outer membrane protein OmpA-like peptidoglycan-associated protein
MKISTSLRANRRPSRLPDPQKRKLRLDAADPRGMPTIILFERGSAELRVAYQDALRRHILYLQAFDHGADFVLRGHANLRTNEPGAVNLSRRRAQAVANRLRSLGVAGKNIKILAQGSSTGLDVAMGGARPLRWNRRVELVIKPFDL